MVRSLLLTIATLFGVGTLCAQTVLTGKVSDGTGEGLIGASVKVLKGTDIVRGGVTNVDGEYRLQIDPGTYDLEVSYTGYTTARTTGVRVIVGKINTANVTMSEGTVLTEVVVTAFKVPLIEQDKTEQGQTLTSDQIENLPTRSVAAIVATTAGVTSIDGGDINIKGSRANATNYYIDGVRVAGTPPPVQDIEQLAVVTGGLGAEYGDVTGGVISVVTKGPASDYHGAVEVENSNGLDPYGWLLATANVSGPIVKRKKADGSKTTLIGFRLSGQYNKQKDDDPPALPVAVIKESVLKNIEAHPIVSRRGREIAAAEFLTNDSMDFLKYRPNQARTDIDLTGKLDFKFTDNIDFSVTGTFRDTRDQFSGNDDLDGNAGDRGFATWRIMNGHNNPTEYQQRYRGIARFRHRLGSDNGSKSENSRISISNANYSLSFAYEHETSKKEDPRHKDRFFDYGYIGRFDFENTPVFGPSPQGLAHIDWTNTYTIGSYKPGYVRPGSEEVIVPNPVLNNYNEFGNGAYDDFEMRNGLYTGVYDNLWSDMFANAGQIYNRSIKKVDDRITITANSGFDLKLGKNSVHNIQFGLMQEQRISRSWRISPMALWDLASRNVNKFSGLDSSKLLSTIILPPGVDVGIFAPQGNFSSDYTSHDRIREAQGAPTKATQGWYEYFNVHNLSPDDLTLDMFSARELTDENTVDYWGYDYTGANQNGSYTFGDFFTHRNAQNIRDFPVAPLTPLYQAAYIKDKFQIKQMIFQLGLRAERYDLNTQVMRDPYSLYQIINAGDFHRSVTGASAKPNNIGDDFKVYVTEPQGNEVKAYRSGDTWYYPDGTQANDGNLIFGGGIVTPFLQDTVIGDNITDPRYDYRTSFEDYTPQLLWLPRISFSLPISDIANFFAHYDVLVQRPSDNWQVTPLNYFNFNIPDRTPTNNANLKPERVVDYEVGYQQKLNEFSALKFSAYYREMRDMVQTRNFLYVPTIGSYRTFGNLDFGTVKGFTWQYDLRRKNNIEMRLAYTLQFADGTGSDPNSQRNISSRGNIRTLIPLTFDERHNFNATIDYRYFGGDKYNGPTINGINILENFGVNLQMVSASGRPYTQAIRPTRFGSAGIAGAINGNRFPWRFNLDMRVDKSFALTKGKNPLNLNVYFRVTNLLNRKNIVAVYRATGSPTDDGYLATAEGRGFVESLEEIGKSREAYLDAYSWLLLNPNNYTQPRRMFVGASFEF